MQKPLQHFLMYVPPASVVLLQKHKQIRITWTNRCEHHNIYIYKLLHFQLNLSYQEMAIFFFLIQLTKCRLYDGTASSHLAPSACAHTHANPTHQLYATWDSHLTFRCVLIRTTQPCHFSFAPWTKTYRRMRGKTKQPQTFTFSRDSAVTFGIGTMSLWRIYVVLERNEGGWGGGGGTLANSCFRCKLTCYNH